MRRTSCLNLMLIACFMSATGVAFAQDPAPMAEPAADPIRGEELFKQCNACHAISRLGASKVGPSLAGVIRRRAGRLDNFNYSDAMSKAGKNGLVWTAEKLDAYLEAPTTYLPKNKMAFVGIKDKSDRRDLIAYLQVLSAPPLPVQKPKT